MTTFFQVIACIDIINEVKSNTQTTFVWINLNFAIYKIGSNRYQTIRMYGRHKHVTCTHAGKSRLTFSLYSFICLFPIITNRMTYFKEKKTLKLKVTIGTILSVRLCFVTNSSCFTSEAFEEQLLSDCSYICGHKADKRRQVSFHLIYYNTCFIA